MCNPALMAAAVGIQGGLQFAAQRQAYQMQKQAQAQAAAAERQRFQQEQTSMRMRQAQEQEAEARKFEQLSLEQQARESRGVVAMGEAGVTQQAVQQDLIAQFGRVRSAMARQQELRSIGVGLGLEEAGFKHQQELVRINKPLQKPSAALAIVDTGVKAAQAYRQMQ
jgi:hypothetical protein